MKGKKSKLDLSFQLNTSSGGFRHIYTTFSKNREQAKDELRRLLDPRPRTPMTDVYLLYDVPGTLLGPTPPREVISFMWMKDATTSNYLWESQLRPFARPNDAVLPSHTQINA